MNKNSRIYVAGHTGLAGSAILRALLAEGYTNIITATSADLDLRNYSEFCEFLLGHKPEYIFMCAGKVGGIMANISSPAEFIYDNLAMATNIIHGAKWFGSTAKGGYRIKKICYLGSSCMYPRLCPQPMREFDIMSGELEPTNEGYAMAKLAGYKMAQAYCKQYGMNIITPVPCNLYGRNDHFEPERSHVMGALVKKFVDAVHNGDKEVEVWGSGQARREFMDVDDFADACLFLMDKYDSPELINVGTGEDVTIKTLAVTIAELCGYKRDIIWNASKPEGMSRKCLDVSRLHGLGYKHGVSLKRGIRDMVAEYKIQSKKEIDEKDSQD
jgi:GDP-L-fucose synthase